MLKLGKYVIIKKRLLDEKDEAMRALVKDYEGSERILGEKIAKIAELEQKLKDSEELHAKYIKDQSKKSLVSRKKWLSGYPGETFGEK